MPSSVRTKRSSRGVGARLLPNGGLDGRGVDLDLLGRRRLAERLEVRLGRAHLGNLGAGSPPRPARRCHAPPRAAGRRGASGAARPRCEPSTSSTVRLWSSRTCDTVSAAASDALAKRRLSSLRLDVDDDVDSGKRLVQRTLDPVGRRMPLPDGRARRDADDDVREVLAAGSRRRSRRSSTGGSSAAIARARRAASSSGERSMRTSTLRRAEPDGRDHDERGHEERRDRVAGRESERRGDESSRARRSFRRSRCRSGARSRAARRCRRAARRAARPSSARRRSRGRARSRRTSTTSARPRTRRHPRAAGSRRPRSRC